MDSKGVATYLGLEKTALEHDERLVLELMYEFAKGDACCVSSLEIIFATKY